MTKSFKILMIGFSILVGVITLEVAASRIVATEVLNAQINLSDETLKFYQDHLTDLHHLRTLDDERWKLNKNPSNAIYSVLTPFKEGRNNILIQGDSWAEQFEKPASKAGLNEFSHSRQVGLVNAGTTSYAPSAMTVQIRKLRDRFQIRPTHVIAIIDQTDIGDELCRYSSRRRFDASNRLIGVSPEPFNSNETYELNLFFQQQAILRSDKFSLLKLLGSAALQTRYHLVKEDRRCAWTDIVRPLEKGLSEAEAENFKSSVRRYVDEVFSDNRVRYLIIITHPHRSHLPTAGSDKYVTYAGDLVREAVASNVHRDKVRLLDFMGSDIGNYLDGDPDDVFKSGDPASHMTDEIHGSEFTPRILREIERLL